MADDSNQGNQEQVTKEVHHHDGGGGSNTWLILLVVVVVVLIAIFAFRGTTNAPTDNNVIPDNIDVQIDGDGGGASGTFEEGSDEAGSGGANE